MTTKQEVIYFVQAGKDGPIKIGHSSTGGLKARIGELQVGSQAKLILLGIELGTLTDETKRHVKFNHLRLRGEWFKPDRDLLEHIRKHTIAINLEINKPNRGKHEHNPQATGANFEGVLQALCRPTPSKSDVRYILTAKGKATINAIRSARDVRHLIGLSLSGMAAEILTTTGRAYTTGAIANMESSKRRLRDGVYVGKRDQFKMPSEVIEVYKRTLIAAVNDASHTAIDLRITITKWGTWRATPIGHCSICGDAFTIKRAGAARCAWCISHGQTRRKAIAK